ncbi:hypothetical protein AB7M17_006122 [Bradyrhizobium sp. USDA 377]
MSNVVSLPPPDWTKDLQRYGSGAPHGTLANVCAMFRCELWLILGDAA